MNGRALSNGLAQFVHRELQIVALAIIGAAVLSGGSALVLGLLY